MLKLFFETRYQDASQFAMQERPDKNFAQIQSYRHGNNLKQSNQETKCEPKDSAIPAPKSPK